MAYWVTGNVTLGVWAKKAGTWTLMGTKIIYINTTVAGAGSNAVNWDATFDMDLGTAVQAFGITVEGYTGTAAALTDFVSAAWQGLAISTDRSATPSGQLSTITVRPQ